VRKGFAFPSSAQISFEATPQIVEAQPPKTFLDLRGKVEPYRTVRRQSRWSSRHVTKSSW
jgi:hypothetical protein